MSDAEDDLSSAVTELADRLRALRDRTDADSGLLTFTERYAIPTAITTLEANIRALEALAGAIRLLQGTEETTAEARARRTAAETADRAVEDVAAAVRGDPTDPEARELLQELRDLRAEIRDRVDGRVAAPEPAATDSDDAPVADETGTRIPVTDATADDGEADAVDIDGEIATIRDEVADERTVFDDYGGEKR